MAKAQVRVLPSARNTVMVIDDQSTGRAILEQVVRSVDERVGVEGFARPVDAVVWATRHVADLVLVDYMMPDMDGIEFVKRLRALPGYEHVPIVMVTVHDHRMSRYSRLIAGALGLEHDEAETIELSAPLHDIGKIGIPDHILLKQAKLDDAEWQVMRRHPVIGHEILKGSASKYVRMGALIALGHHEKYEGSGYPNGLVGDHIPLCARIVAVADVYDALTSVRPYKTAWPEERAFEYITSQAGRHFDPRMVDAFLGMKSEVGQIQREWRDPLTER